MTGQPTGKEETCLSDKTDKQPVCSSQGTNFQRSIVVKASDPFLSCFILNTVVVTPPEQPHIKRLPEKIKVTLLLRSGTQNDRHSVCFKIWFKHSAIYLSGQKHDLVVYG